MNERLSRLVASLLAQAKEGEDPSSGINRVRTIIKKVIEGEDTIFGKFQALVESFREVIPEEKQRYQAAIKALSATSKLSREEIVAAVDNQLEQLKILEKLLIPALPRGPEKLKAMEAKSQKMRNEISRLREKIARLEKEEKEIANSMAGQGTAVLEKAMREVFTDIGAEITSIKKKIEDLHAESGAQQPIPDTGTVKTDFPEEKKQGGEKSTTGQISSDHGTKPEKTCPMCGGQMSFSATRNMWHCFSCAYEELKKDEVPSKNGERSEDTIFSEPARASEPEKKCRICGGRMDYYIAERKWQCYSCAYEESEKTEVQGKKGESGQTIFPEPGEYSNAPEPGGQTIFPEPGEHSSAPEPGGQTIFPEPAPASGLKQTCPMCGGRMDYYAAERKWQCYSCGFESNEYNKDEGQGKSEEKRDHSNALLAIPAAESLFDLSSTGKSSPGYWEPKKASPSKKQPALTKTCPACNKKMHWYGPDKGWQCGHCGYERRI